MAPTPTPDSARAHVLYKKWVAQAQADGYTPAEVMLTAVGTIAELIRANAPPAAWDTHLATLTSHVRMILVGDTDDHRTASPSAERKPRRARQRVPQQDPGQS